MVNIWREILWIRTNGMEKLVTEIIKAKKQNNLTKAVIGLEPSGHYWKASCTLSVLPGLQACTGKSIPHKKDKRN